MPVRIEITTKIADARALVRRKKFAALGFAKKIKGLSISDVYLIDKEYSSRQTKIIAGLLTNPIIHSYSIITSGKRKKKQRINGQKFAWGIEIGFLPGVTDNVGGTAKELIQDSLKIPFVDGENIYTSQVTNMYGDLTHKDIIVLADALYNPLIQRSVIHNYMPTASQRGKKRQTFVNKISIRDMERVTSTITIPVVQAMGRDGSLFKGILGADVVLTQSGPQLLNLDNHIALDNETIAEFDYDLLSLIEGVVFETLPHPER